MTDAERLDKIIANSGWGSRTDVKKMIKAGLIQIDGLVAKDAGMKVNPSMQKIEIDGFVLQYEKFVYLMMHKPQGVISATEDLRHQTCIDLLPQVLKNRNLFPAGRLDIDTEGLLLLTNDGQLAHQILSPKKHVWKTYLAHVQGSLHEMEREAFEKGLILEDGYETLPAKLEILKNGYEADRPNISEVYVSIREGKFHQIKRMFEALNKQVIYLKRLSLGPIHLDPKLSLGEFRALTETEKEALLTLK